MLIAALLALLMSLPAYAGVARVPLEIVQRPFPAASSISASTPALPPYLSVANPADSARIAGILRAASASPTAVAVLARVAQAAEARGRPVIIEAAGMRESGTYNLDWGILSLRRRSLNAEPRTNVATLIHEFQHLLQTDRNIPSDLLEAELEAYVVDFRVSRELKDRPRRGSYDARAQAKFKEGLEPFMGFLRKQYPEDSPLHRTRSRDYENRLRAGLERSHSTLKRLQSERRSRRRVLEQMREVGHLNSELAAYRQDVVAPLDAAIMVMNRVIEWGKKDIAMLANPKTRAKARAYARSVIRRARAFQKVFSRG